MEQLANSVAGGLGNASGLLVTYPLTVIKTRLQSQRKKEGKSVEKVLSQPEDGSIVEYSGPMDALKKILAFEGVSGLYKGVLLKVAETYMWNSTFYFFFSSLKTFADAFPTSDAAKIVHGMVSGMCTQLVLFPLVVINTRMVNKRKAARAWENGLKSSALPAWVHDYRDVVLDIHKNSSFWQGISAGLMLTINPGIVTMLRARFTTIARAGTGFGKTRAVQDFWIGFLSKCIASTITYPLVVCRSQIVTELKRKGKNKPNIIRTLLAPALGVLKVLRTMKKVVECSGFSALYAGVLPHLSQAALKEAVANSIRRQLVLLFLIILKIEHTPEHDSES
ncbi:hypothetical protein AAMO2058_000027600 [Amorphochlora amoebiformis]